MFMSYTLTKTVLWFLSNVSWFFCGMKLFVRCWEISKQKRRNLTWYLLHYRTVMGKWHYTPKLLQIKNIIFLIFFTEELVFEPCFGSSNARKPIKASKDSDYSLVSNKSLSREIDSLVNVQRSMTSSKNAKVSFFHIVIAIKPKIQSIQIVLNSKLEGFPDLQRAYPAL